MAAFGGELGVKRLVLRCGRVLLVPENLEYPGSTLQGSSLPWKGKNHSVLSAYGEPKSVQLEHSFLHGQRLCIRRRLSGFLCGLIRNVGISISIAHEAERVGEFSGERGQLSEEKDPEAVTRVPETA